jgi:hypothetical protein
MPIHVIEHPIYECFGCGETYTREEIEEAGGFRPDCDDLCPSCGEDAPICLIGGEDWKYHISCKDAGRMMAKAFPEMDDFVTQMKDAGRGHLVRGKEAE